MIIGLKEWLWNKIIDWLVAENRLPEIPLCNFEHLSFELRSCDVVLVEGVSRVSSIIKSVTQSPWTHSALYIGRIHDIEAPELREHVQKFYNGAIDDQLIVEALLGQGIVVSPLRKYCDYHLRICRPRGLSRKDAQQVIAYAVGKLGNDYDVRQLLDLARFLLPYGILPRRWRSSLFERRAGDSTRTVCSSMLAEAFTSVHFPVLPIIHRVQQGQLRLYQRNCRLFTPQDFDYSPYFEIIKYPLLGFDELAPPYRRLPWESSNIVCNDAGDCFSLEQDEYQDKNEAAVAAEPVSETLANAPAVDSLDSTDGKGNDLAAIGGTARRWYFPLQNYIGLLRGLGNGD